MKQQNKLTISKKISIKRYEMVPIMEITEKQLEKIGDYVKNNFDRLSNGSRYAQIRSADLQIIERITRIEEEMKSQREIIMFGFQQTEKRFDDINKRFEDVNRRFDGVNKRFDDTNKRFDDVNKRFDDVNARFRAMMWAMGIGVTVISLTISLITIFIKS